MNIIICGAGQVGFHIARYLSGEQIDVTVVDQSPELIGKINDQLDVYVNVDNVLNDAAIVSRSPYGARGNMPRSFTLGVDYKF